MPAMWETPVRSLGSEDPLEKGPATHSSILAWRIQWTGHPGGLQSMGSQRVGHNGVTNTCMGEAWEEVGGNCCWSEAAIADQCGAGRGGEGEEKGRGNSVS